MSAHEVGIRTPEGSYTDRGPTKEVGIPDFAIDPHKASELTSAEITVAEIKHKLFERPSEIDYHDVVFAGKQAPEIYDQVVGVYIENRRAQNA